MFEKIFPTKTRKISSDDAPWISHEIKTLLRKKKRIYRKHRKSEVWSKIKSSKAAFYKDQIADLKTNKPHQWYSILKRLSAYDQHKTEPLQ